MTLDTPRKRRGLRRRRGRDHLPSLYLAVQIRQNTKAVRSSSYHQAAEQTWHYCLAIAQDPTLVYGFENMLRLYEEGLIDPDVWNNVLQDSMPFLGGAFFRGFLAARPGPLSKRLLVAIEKLPHLHPPEAA